MEALLAILALIPWKNVLAFLLPVLILGVVQIIKKNREWLKPYLPIIAPILGAILPLAAGALGAFLGIVVDFSPILAALNGAIAGAAAVGLNQVWRQRVKVKKSREYDRV